jgi:hypothetical protein
MNRLSYGALRMQAAWQARRQEGAVSDSSNLGISGTELVGLVVRFGWKVDGEGPGWARVASCGWEFVVIPTDPRAADYAARLERAKTRIHGLGGVPGLQPASGAG